MSQPLRLSRLAQKMRPSPIRELFALIQQPGMISFAGGLPDPAAFPVEPFAACADVLDRDGRRVLQYGASEGYPVLREQLLDLMAEHLDRAIDPTQLLITSGSQQAVDLIGRALLDPDDVVVVEAPTYPGTLHCLRNTGARFLAVPCDGDGMRVELLPELVRRCEDEVGARPKLIYSVPDFSNPSGACMSLDRRRRLVELACQLEIPVFEDDPYSRVRYAGDDLPAVSRLGGASPLFIYASSFSKILAPGVRVAWTVASAQLIRAMVLVRQGEDLCTSTVTQALVAEYCQRGHLRSHLPHIVATYAGKCAAMQRSLLAHDLDRVASWDQPQGGFFFWLRFHHLDCTEAFRRAVAEKVAFVPGTAFYPEPSDQVGAPTSGSAFGRLCFTFADPDEIDEGCRRLATALRG